MIGASKENVLILSHDINLKNKPMKLTKFALLAAAAATLSSATAATSQLLTNGDFETGNFTGWTTSSQPNSNGSISIDTPGTTTPVSGQSTAPALPGNGAFYSVTDQGGPGTYSLVQSFTVPAGVGSVILAFEMFVNSYSGGPAIVGVEGLDHNGGPNQHARVDLLSSTAGAFDTGAGVLANFYLGVDVGTNPNAFNNYSFDITGLVAPGGTYQIRFAQTDNQGFFNQGVDNASILATTRSPGGSVPDTGTTLLLLGLSLGTVFRIAGLRKKSA
jgi:hypothetical protein